MELLEVPTASLSTLVLQCFQYFIVRQARRAPEQMRISFPRAVGTE